MIENNKDGLQGIVLDDDVLDSVAGGVGMDSEKTEVEGTVVGSVGANNFQVNLENGDVVVARPSGKVIMACVRFQLGDRVQVTMYPNGSNLITYRYRPT
ncbi:MAG: hypothetical protein IJ608_13280 [Lachnospiraceae bacterium]|nr:hypothetical protein [Lachnospiraceae bacterium]